jgi:hypothetical protein
LIIIANNNKYNQQVLYNNNINSKFNNKIIKIHKINKIKEFNNNLIIRYQLIKNKSYKNAKDK